MKPIRWLASVTVCFFLVGTVEVRGTPILVTSSTLNARVGDPEDPSGIQELTIQNVALPFTGNLVAEAGPSRSSNTYDFQMTDDTATFHWNTDLLRGGIYTGQWGYKDFAGGYVRIDFTALENAVYDISGGSVNSCVNCFWGIAPSTLITPRLPSFFSSYQPVMGPSGTSGPTSDGATASIAGPAPGASATRRSWSS
jgi:hypothetical protein